MLFYINNVDNKEISEKMDLAISNPNDYKTLICQGGLSDAFINSVTGQFGGALSPFQMTRTYGQPWNKGRSVRARKALSQQAFGKSNLHS